MSGSTHISTAPPAGIPGEAIGAPNSTRRFEFGKDSFAFANELLWEYTFDAASGTTQFQSRLPKPEYAHRCFVLTRAARQFFDHARFAGGALRTSGEECRRLVRAVLARDPRKACVAGHEIVIPGYAGLREFSGAHETMLKEECGGAWRSYVLRSHWRMIFPISREHQLKMAAQLPESIRNRGLAVIHLFRFPALTINHGMILFGAMETSKGIDFEAYDPNDTEKPARLSFDRATRTFYLPPTRYWAGGEVDVREIYRTWFG